MSVPTIILIIVAVAAVLAIMTYNRLVTLRQGWKGALADIDVQLKQRHDLIPNLVETVKGYAGHESGVFEKVTVARTAAMQAQSPQAKTAAEGALTGALSSLYAVAENYPQLKANENFMHLQAELGDIENKIAASRRYLNNAVAEYNGSIQQFPAVVFAGPLGFASADMYALDTTEKAEASVPPKVSFGG